MTAFDEKTVLVLQGGGALGAYQAGAYEALAEAGEMPSWVAGVSIGAVNSAIIAGNPPERRIERLRAFWDGVSSWLPGRPLAHDDNSRRVFNETSCRARSVFRRARLLRAARPAALPSPQGTPSGDQRLRHAPAQRHLARACRFRPSELRSGASQRRRRPGAHRQPAIFRHQ